MELLANHVGRNLYTRKDGSTSLTFVNLPFAWKTSPIEFQRHSELERHYWRGLLDGDGYLSYINGKLIVTLCWHESQAWIGESFCRFVARLGMRCNTNGGPHFKTRVQQEGPQFAEWLYQDSAFAIQSKKERALL